jgi:tetratricopeptide (TPR) repeat protein
MRRLISLKKTAWMLGFLLIGTAAGLTAQTAADHLQAGDELYARFDDAGALAEYEKAAALDGKNFAAQWKTARGYMNLGDRVDYGQKDHEQKQQALYRAGETFLRKALSLDPRDSHVRFLNAALLGRLARAMSREQQIAAAYTIKGEIDRALALDPANDMAWHGLAFWHRTLAEVGGAARFFGGLLYGKIPKGSFEEAVAGFRKAIDLNPGFCGHHIELARTYLALKKKDMAAAELRAGLACTDLTSQCSHFKERARRMLTRLEKG